MLRVYNRSIKNLFLNHRFLYTNNNYCINLKNNYKYQSCINNNNNNQSICNYCSTSNQDIHNNKHHEQHHHNQHHQTNQQHHNDSHQHHNHKHHKQHHNEKESHQKQQLKIPSARSVLKKFFLKVHPDLFYQYPKLKNVNDKSLRILQSFLEEIKSEKVSSRSYKLEFYYLDSKSATSTNESDIPFVETSFDIDNSTPRKLNHMVKKAEEKIQQLLKITGIKEEFYLNSLLGRTVRQPTDTFEVSDSLLSFLSNYSSDARDKSNYIIDEERSIDIMYTFFFMEHRIRVLFDHDLEFSTDKKKSILRDLESILHKLSPRVSDEQLVDKIFYSRDRAKNEQKRRDKLETFHFTDEQIDQQDDIDYQTESVLGFGQRLKRGGPQMKEQLFEPYGMFKDKNTWRGWDKIKAGFITPETTEKSDDSHITLRLEGMTLFFTNKNGVDLEGRLQLNGETPDDWTNELNALKPSVVIKNIKACRDRKNLEIEAANSIGVGGIFTDYNEQNSREYIDYLNTLIENSSKDQIRSKLNDINLRIVTSKSTNIEPYTLDERNGVMNIPLNGNITDIIHFVDKCSEHVIREFTKNQNQIRNISQLELTVKRQFRLSKLKRDPSISDLDMVSCCKRLLRNHQPFLPLLFNIKLTIGKENLVEHDGSLTIRWDFEL